MAYRHLNLVFAESTFIRGTRLSAVCLPSTFELITPIMYVGRLRGLRPRTIDIYIVGECKGAFSHDIRSAVHIMCATAESVEIVYVAEPETFL